MVLVLVIFGAVASCTSLSCKLLTLSKMEVKVGSRSIILVAFFKKVGAQFCINVTLQCHFMGHHHKGEILTAALMF